MRFLFGSVLLFCLAQCQTNWGTGLISGTVLGLGSGYLFMGGSGTAITAAAGAITGGLIGLGLDMEDRKLVEKSSPRTLERIDREEPLTLNDVIKLSQSGISDLFLLEYMEKTQSIYSLSHSQARRLQNSGVSERVIQHMLKGS